MKRILCFLLLSLSMNSQALTIGTYNVRNFDYDQRANIRTNKAELGKLINSLKVDVLSLEEINNTKEFENFTAKTFPGYDTQFSRCGGEHGQHVGFLYNTAVVEMLSFSEDLSISEPGSTGGCDTGSRPAGIALFRVKSTNQRFFGITVHLKSGSDSSSTAKRLKQFQVIKKIVETLIRTTGVHDFYVAGDMNTTEYLSKGSDYKALTALAQSLGMVDLTQNFPCSAYWWGGSDDGIETPSLLDHILVTPGLVKKQPVAAVHGHCSKVSCRQASLKELGIIYGEVSDHCPVTAVIQ